MLPCAFPHPQHIFSSPHCPVLRGQGIVSFSHSSPPATTSYPATTTSTLPWSQDFLNAQWLVSHKAAFTGLKVACLYIDSLSAVVLLCATASYLEMVHFHSSVRDCRIDGWSSGESIDLTMALERAILHCKEAIVIGRDAFRDGNFDKARPIYQQFFRSLNVDNIAKARCKAFFHSVEHR